MNCFVEGLQGSGKSTLVGRLAEKHPGDRAIREGDYSPVELSWCDYMTQPQYQSVLAKYPELRLCREVFQGRFTVLKSKNYSL